MAGNGEMSAVASGPFMPGEYVVVEGLRYIVPFDSDSTISLKDQFVGMEIGEALARMFRLQKGTQV